MSTDVVTLAVYSSYAALAEIGGHRGAFAFLMAPYAVVAMTLVIGSAHRRRTSRKSAQNAANWM
jgi:hypothetical protein